MAGRRKAVEPPLMPTTAMVASAVAYSGGKVSTVYRKYESWQREAWRFFEVTPELRFAAGWIGAALSRCVLLPGEVDTQTGTVKASKDETIRQALQGIFSGVDGQPQMLYTMGVHLTVVGETYLVGRQITGGAYSWEVISNEEMNVRGDRWVITSGMGLAPITLGPADIVIRIWRPDPKNRFAAHSSVRALLPTLTEIEYLTRHIFAQTTSRVAGAGVWVIPSEIEFPGSENATNKADAFMKLVGKGMMTSLKDPSDPSSLVPIIVTAPGEQIKNMKDPIHFWSPFEDKAVSGRVSAVERFCVGMDIPVEVVMGMSRRSGGSGGGSGTGASHWSAWQIEESAIKLHVEPALELIGNGISVGYLRDATANPRAAICYNTTTLRLRPDLSKQAVELSQAGRINDAALLRENGFDPDTDSISPEEYRRFLLQRIAGAAAAPEQVGYAMKALTNDENFPMPDSGAGPQAREHTPSVTDHPAPQGPPLDPGRAALEPLVRASEGVVLRALERAGNRLRSNGVRPEGVPAHEVYLHAGSINGNAKALLADAWSTVPIIADGLADAEHLTAVLNSYTEHLLQSKQKHSRSVLARYLELV